MAKKSQSGSLYRLCNISALYFVAQESLILLKNFSFSSASILLLQLIFQKLSTIVFIGFSAQFYSKFSGTCAFIPQTRKAYDFF